MASSKGQPTAQTSALLERVGSLLDRTEAAYALGDGVPESTATALQAEWTAVLKAAHGDQESREGKDLMTFIMVPIIAGGMESRVLSLVFGDRKKAAEYAGVAEDWHNVCQRTKTAPPLEFTRYWAGKALDSLDESLNEPVQAKPGGIFRAYAQKAQLAAGVGSRLRRWCEKTYVDRQVVGDKVAAEITRRTDGKPAPDPKADLERKIAETDVAVKTAVAKGTSEGYAEAGKLAGELTGLRKQLEELNAKPAPVAAPTQPEKPVAQTGKPPTANRKGLLRKAAEITGLAAPTPSAPTPAPTAAPAPEAAPAATAPAGPNGGVMDVKSFASRAKSAGLESAEYKALVVRFGSDPTGAIETLEALEL